MWRHLFLEGEYAERKRLLSGLTLSQVTQRPGGAPHSIYDELWHLAAWQRIVVERDEAAGEAWLESGPDFPDEPPKSEAEWEELVAAFLQVAQKAIELGQATQGSDIEIDDGATMTDALNSLAVHNAYHFGKIVALRQALGAWPPD